MVWADASFMLVLITFQIALSPNAHRTSTRFACAELGAVISAEAELCGPSSDWEPLFLQEDLADLVFSPNSVKH